MILFLLAVSIVDEILLTGTDVDLRNFINGFGSAFKLDKSVQRPEIFRFYGLNIIQHHTFSISIRSDDKLNDRETY